MRDGGYDTAPYAPLPPCSTVNPKPNTFNPKPVYPKTVYRPQAPAVRVAPFIQPTARLWQRKTQGSERRGDKIQMFPRWIRSYR